MCVCFVMLCFMGGGGVGRGTLNQSREKKFKNLFICGGVGRYCCSACPRCPIDDLLLDSAEKAVLNKLSFLTK